jgi:drug/metabolite transporter (DMT)-like permease
LGRRTALRLPALGLAPGLAAILGVTLLFAAMDTTAKFLTERYDPLFVVWARYAGQAAVTLALLAPALPRLARTARPGLQVLRSAFLFTATLLFFAAFARMPLAEVTAIGQTSPILLTALAALVLGERVGPVRWACVGLGFLGALVIVQPGGAAFRWAALLPLAGAFMFAAFNVATRALGRDDGPWTTFFYTGMVGACGATLLLPFVWQAPAPGDLPLLVLVGLLGAGGQAFLIVAMRAAPASHLAPFFYVQLVWAAGFGYLVFGDVPAPTTLLGAAIVVGAGLVVQWREGRARYPGPPG